MPRRDAETINRECDLLVQWAEAFLGQLHRYRSQPAEYYQRKAKTLRDYKAPTASIRLRALKMGIGDLLEMTDDLRPDAVTRIDSELAAKGQRTLTDVRKRL